MCSFVENGFLINCVHPVCFCYICNLTSCEIHTSWQLDIFSRGILYYSSFLCIIYFMTFIIELFADSDFTSNLPAAKIYAFFVLICFVFKVTFLLHNLKAKILDFFSVMHHRGMKLLRSLQCSKLNGLNMCVHVNHASAVHNVCHTHLHTHWYVAYLPIPYPPFYHSVMFSWKL